MTKRKRWIKRKAYEMAGTLLRHDAKSSELRDHPDLNDEERELLYKYLTDIANELLNKSDK